MTDTGANQEGGRRLCDSILPSAISHNRHNCHNSKSFHTEGISKHYKSDCEVLFIVRGLILMISYHVLFINSELGSIPRHFTSPVTVALTDVVPERQATLSRTYTKIEQIPSILLLLSRHYRWSNIASNYKLYYSN
jgi:hypothetical protein